jgi:GT2 family glycosyltransferase
MDKNLPIVSIVLLNWNGLEDTLECLFSLKKLTYPAVEIIVVDNASKDNQAEKIESAFPDVTVLKQTENLGFCGGCNAGIKYALEGNSDFVMLLNNDTIVSTDLIENLLAGTEDLENAGAVSPLIMWYPETDKIWYSRARWISEKAHFTLADETDEYSKLKDSPPYKTEFACGCCLLAPAQIFRERGLFDERYFAFYEEAAWCATIKKAGLDFYVVPKAVIYHKGSKSVPGLVSTYLMTRNRLLWMKENLSFSKRLESFPFLTTNLLGQYLNILGLTKEHLSKKHSRAIIQGYKDYFLGKFYKWDGQMEKLTSSDDK